MTEPIRPFRIDVAEAVLDDLRERLRRTRWPEHEPVDDWSHGVPLDWIRDVCTYWGERYDWRAREAALNRFSQSVTAIDGLDIHFVHVRSPHPDAMPLVITHGWPGSIVEFHKVIEPLTDPVRFGGDPADAFTVVAPSLPGYGFSGPPVRPDGSIGPIGPRAIAGLWHTLVHDKLNYRRPYGVQGGDWGAVVSSWAAFDHPVRPEDGDWQSGVLGLHLNMIGLRPGIDLGTARLGDDEKAWLARVEAERDDKTAYQRIQATRPQTLGMALADSPVGLAAWIVEKFRDWSDCDGDVERRFSKDDLLTTVSLYWFTQTFHTSARIYADTRRVRPRPVHDRMPEVEAPTAIAVFPQDVIQYPRAVAERHANLQRWTVMPRGGHFAPMEEPELLVEDIREAFRGLREQVR